MKMRQKALEAIFMRKTDKKVLIYLNHTPYKLCTIWRSQTGHRPLVTNKIKIKKRSHIGDLESSCEQLSKKII